MSQCQVHSQRETIPHELVEFQSPETPTGLRIRWQLFDNPVPGLQQPKPQVLPDPLGQIDDHGAGPASLNIQVRFEVDRDRLAIEPGDGQ